MRQVVITGVGIRTPMGHDLDAVRKVFLSGRPVIRSFEGPNGRVRVGAKIEDDLFADFSRSEKAMFDPMALMTLLATDDLVRDSGLRMDQVDKDRMGVYVGSGQGAMESKYLTFSSIATKDRCAALSVMQGLDNGAANQVSIRNGLRGSAETTVLACSSSNVAMGNAMRSIRHGYIDAAIAGGADATFTEGGMRAWEAMRVLAQFDPAHPERACRPFSKDRTGLVLGEGAAFYLFEAEEHARARGARIYAKVAGYATSSDAKHLSAPDSAGQALCIERCLQDAGMEPSNIGYINCHGTATLAGDIVETASIRSAFGSRADSTPVSATKSLHGHALGAAGAIELLASLVALNDGILAPTANLEVPDEQCDLDYVPVKARTGVDVKATLSISFAFGGTNACLELARA